MSTIRDEATPLELYCHNLTKLVQQGTFAPLAGQEAVTNRAFQILERKNKCCPMILDPNESRRVAVVLEIVRQMASGEAGEAFAQQQVIALDFEALFSHLSEDMSIRRQQRERILQWWKQRQQVFPSLVRDEEKEMLPARLEAAIDSALVHERFRSILTAMRQAEGTFILFVDYFPRLVGADNGIDAANELVPVLARRQIALIGGSTLEQHRKYVERDAAFQRRFQEIVLPVV